MNEEQKLVYTALFFIGLVLVWCFYFQPKVRRRWEMKHDQADREYNQQQVQDLTAMCETAHRHFIKNHPKLKDVKLDVTENSLWSHLSDAFPNVNWITSDVLVRLMTLRNIQRSIDDKTIHLYLSVFYAYDSAISKDSLINRLNTAITKNRILVKAAAALDPDFEELDASFKPYGLGDSADVDKLKEYLALVEKENNTIYGMIEKEGKNESGNH